MLDPFRQFLAAALADGLTGLRAQTAGFDPVAAGQPALGVPAAFLGVAQLPALAQTAQMASNACWSSGSSQHAVMC